MTHKRKSLLQKIAIALLLRPPVLLILVPLCLLLLHERSSSHEVTVEERFELSSSIKSPYGDIMKGVYQYSFAFCADPHLHEEGDGCFPDLDAAIREKRINFVVFGGDLTYSGREGEYRNFVNQVNALTARTYMALGNHDLYNGGWSYYWRYLGPSSYSFYGGNAKFVVIDSATAHIGTEQMEWIRKELRTNKQPLLFVISHIPIYGVADARYEFPRGQERTELIGLLEKYEVDYVLQGHYHSHVDMTVNGVRYITSGSFSDGPLNSGDRHFLLFRIYGPTVAIEKVLVGRGIPVEYMNGDV